MDTLSDDLNDDLRDQLVLECFVDGLASRSIRQRLREEWPVNLDRAIVRALQLHAADQIEALATSSTSTEPTVAVAAPIPQPDSEIERLVKALVDSHLQLVENLPRSTES